MKTLVQPNSNVMSLLNKQMHDNNLSYRPLNFLITETNNHGDLYIFNNMTKGLYVLDKTEAEAFRQIEITHTNIQTLLENWCIVPVDFDEIKTFDQIRDVYSSIRKEETKSITNSFTILPTTECNARCYYCYQKNCKIYTMDEETAHEVASYISKKIHNNYAYLRWFGGEPLVANKIIDIICQNLVDKGISIESSIISNGYLFNEKMVHKACSLWNLKHAQITLDGTEEVYNQAKNYMTGGASASPFETVINNIELLVKNDVRVNIRINISEKNEEDVKNLVCYLSGRFDHLKNLKNAAGQRMLNVYVHTLFQEISDLNNKISNESLDERYLFEIEIVKLIKTENLSSGYQLPMYIRANHCMADNGCAAVVLPDGALTLCEHQVSGEANFGSIFDDKIDNNIILDWQTKHPIGEKCTACPCYPSCIRLKNCPNIQEKCMPAKQKWEISKLHNALNNLINQ